MFEMFEWFFEPYSLLPQGVAALLVIPGTCGAPVDLLRALTLLLGAAAGVRIRGHCVAYQRLRRHGRADQGPLRRRPAPAPSVPGLRPG